MLSLHPKSQIMARIIVREILKAKGVSIKELAARMGITSSAVSQLLANPHPSIQQLDRIANAIGVDVMDLFSQDFSYINGYVETGDVIYPIKSREQFINLIYKVEGIAQIPLSPREDSCKMEIKDFLNQSISKSKSGARMIRYGINKVFTLTYDAGPQHFSLTQCVSKGEIRFKIFSVKDYLNDGNTLTDREFNQLLEAIHSEIDN